LLGAIYIAPISPISPILSISPVDPVASVAPAVAPADSVAAVDASVAHFIAEAPTISTALFSSISPVFIVPHAALAVDSTFSVAVSTPSVTVSTPVVNKPSASKAAQSAAEAAALHSHVLERDWESLDPLGLFPQSALQDDDLMIPSDWFKKNSQDDDVSCFFATHEDANDANEFSLYIPNYGFRLDSATRGDPSLPTTTKSDNVDTNDLPRNAFEYDNESAFWIHQGSPATRHAESQAPVASDFDVFLDPLDPTETQPTSSTSSTTSMRRLPALSAGGEMRRPMMQASKAKRARTIPSVAQVERSSSMPFSTPSSLVIASAAAAATAAAPVSSSLASIGTRSSPPALSKPALSKSRNCSKILTSADAASPFVFIPSCDISDPLCTTMSSVAYPILQEEFTAFMAWLNPKLLQNTLDIYTRTCFKKFFRLYQPNLTVPFDVWFWIDRYVDECLQGEAGADKNQMRSFVLHFGRFLMWKKSHPQS
jgi:hypothetical protein